MKKNKLFRIVSNLLHITLLISPLVLIHEAAHALTAYYYGHTIESASLGFGPSLYHVDINNIIYHIRLLPFGGYVTLPTSVINAPIVTQIYITLAGVLINILIAFLIVWYTSDKSIISNLLKYNMDFGGISLLGRWSWELGVFNLLPIIGLDGGKVLVLLLTYYFAPNVAVNIVIWTNGIILVMYLLFKKPNKSSRIS